MEGKMPWQGYIGIVLVLIFWYVNWFLDGLRTHWAFFPLWLGYCFFIDGCAVWLGRKSIIVTRPLHFMFLFFISIPAWWLFEFLNNFTGYWKYLPEDAFGPVQHTFWSTVCFSTVVPAVFTTANFLAAFTWFRRHHIGIRAGATKKGQYLYLITGVILLGMMFLWPSYGMAFMWMSLFLVISPINLWLGRPSILLFTARKDWRIVVLLFAATLWCGFFWELWNMYAWPKWIYTFPFLNGFKIFEMPLAGYLGYLPFGLEIWAMTALVFPGFVRRFIQEMHKTE